MGQGGARAFSRPYETLRTFVRFDPTLTGKEEKFPQIVQFLAFVELGTDALAQGVIGLPSWPKHAGKQSK